jgi:aldose 1-epimerase
MQNFSKMNKADFEAVIDGKQTSLYILKNANGVELSVSNFGGRVVEIFTPDKNGNFEDIALGLKSINDYVNFKSQRFFGATVGRFGNRIANGKFSLNGREYVLEQNNGTNSLHGGVKGFDMKVWDVISASDKEIKFKLVSPDGDEGFPAELTVVMTYRLTYDNEFEIIHEAQSNADTIINLTHHSFFNLHGEGIGDTNDHILTINADKFVPVDEKLIPTGELRDVQGTPHDFRTPMVIGARVNDDDQQLNFGNGYDHCWVLNKSKENELTFAAEVYEPVSGRTLKVYTTEPGMQFYGGNFFDGEIGKSGKPYPKRCSLALETQHYPDSPNQPNFPTTVLKTGEKYLHICKYVFGVK